nr:aspartyl-phosphate phosphatase Spo0E family protein [Caldalkalibacillus mannanilyticus]
MLLVRKKSIRTKSFFLFRNTWTTTSENKPDRNPRILYFDKRKCNNKDEHELLGEIEKLREELTELVSKKGFASIEVIKLSQRLDRHIVEIQKRFRDSFHTLKNRK